jgi:hypothetical protein
MTREGRGLAMHALSCFTSPWIQDRISCLRIPSVTDGPVQSVRKVGMKEHYTKLIFQSGRLESRIGRIKHVGKVAEVLRGEANGTR